MTENSDSAAPELVQVARLDADDIYHGLDQIPVQDLTADHVPLPNGCDLPTGRYRWDRERKTFVDAGPPAERAAEAPVALNALAWGLLAMHGAGITLPAASRAWLKHYIDTIDFVFTKSNEAEADLLRRFAEES